MTTTITRWTGWLFAVGSLCFLVASLASQWQDVERAAIGVTFFAGSIFFTAAAYLQHHLAVREVVRSAPLLGSGMRPHRPATWSRKHADVLASLIQLVGTVFFNVNTFDAMEAHLSAQQANLRIWAPDTIGSICFLVSSQIAFSSTCRAWIAIRLRDRDWQIAAVNLLGSIAFGVAAGASLVEPSSSEPVSASISNIATAIGAVGFLVGALLMLPPRAGQVVPVPGSACPTGSA
jgi:hypothetical protein